MSYNNSDITERVCISYFAANVTGGIHLVCERYASVFESIHTKGRLTY